MEDRFYLLLPVHVENVVVWTSTSWEGGVCEIDLCQSDGMGQVIVIQGVNDSTAHPMPCVNLCNIHLNQLTFALHKLSSNVSFVTWRGYHICVDI